MQVQHQGHCSAPASCSVRFMWKGGKPRVTVVMHRRVDRRIRVDLSLEDLFPRGPRLPLDAAHFDLAPRACRKSWLETFRRLQRCGTGNREQLAAAIQIVFAFAGVVATEAARPGVALWQNVHTGTDRRLVGDGRTPLRGARMDEADSLRPCSCYEPKRSLDRSRRRESVRRRSVRPSGSVPSISRRRLACFCRWEGPQ